MSVTLSSLPGKFKSSLLNDFLSWWNYSQLQFNWTEYYYIYIYIYIYIYEFIHDVSLRIYLFVILFLSTSVNLSIYLQL